MKTSSRQRSRAAMCGLATVLIGGLQGCDTLARSQGKFAVASSFGSSAISDDGFPLNPDLFVDEIDRQGQRTGRRIPLVKVAYRKPSTGQLVNRADAPTNWSDQSYYKVIDVTNIDRDPMLGAPNDATLFKKRLTIIANMLIDAADTNGEVYWRHLTTFLETYKAVNSSSRAAMGAAIAGAFISPVLGAGLAGGALTADTFVVDFTSGLNVDEYAQLRDAASTYRKKVKGELFEAIENARPDSRSVNGVLQRAYDYAFTYSIKGAIHAAARQNSELKNLLITNESAWKRFFRDEAMAHLKQQIADGKIVGAEKLRIEALLAAQAEEAKRQEAELFASTTKKVSTGEDLVEGATVALAEAQIARQTAERERETSDAALKKLEAILARVTGDKDTATAAVNEAEGVRDTIVSSAVAATQAAIEAKARSAWANTLAARAATNANDASAAASKAAVRASEMAGNEGIDEAALKQARSDASARAAESRTAQEGAASSRDSSVAASRAAEAAQTASNLAAANVEKAERALHSARAAVRR